MLRFVSSLASKFNTSIQPVCCSTWSRNYAAAASKRFFDCTRYKRDLVEVMNNCDEPTSKEDYSPVGKEALDVRQLREGTKMALDSVLGNLHSRAEHITTFEEIAEYATAALNGDREVGELIAKAFEKGWEDNLHIKADGNTNDNALMLYKGMILDRGYLFPYLITNRKRLEFVLQSVDVLIHEKKLSNYGIMFDLLRNVAPRGYKGRDILIVAEDVENDLLATLVLHGMCTGTKVFVIKPPGFGESRKAILQEIVKITGGRVITEDSCNWSFGYALEIAVSKDQTVILDYPSCGEHAQRSTVENLQDFPAKHPTKHSNILAVLQVSGANKTEVCKKKNRVASAINAVKAAKEEGVGSGLSLLYALNELDKLKTTNYGQKTGVQTIKDALETLLLNMIASTVGVKTSVIFDNLVKLENLDPEDYMREGGYAILPFPKLDKLLMQDNPIFVYDPASDEHVDIVVRSETVFPLKTLRTVLVQASSEMLARRGGYLLVGL